MPKQVGYFGFAVAAGVILFMQAALLSAAADFISTIILIGATFLAGRMSK